MFDVPVKSEQLVPYVLVPWVEALDPSIPLPRQSSGQVRRRKTEDGRQNEESSIEFVPFRGYIFSVFSVANFRNDKMKRAPHNAKPVGFFGILL